MNGITTCVDCYSLVLVGVPCRAGGRIGGQVLIILRAQVRRPQLEPRPDLQERLPQETFACDNTVLCAHHPKASFCPSPFIPLYFPLLPSTHIPYVAITTSLCISISFFLLFLFFFIQSLHLHPVHQIASPKSSQPDLHQYVSILLVTSFCSLDYTYE